MTRVRVVGLRRALLVTVLHGTTHCSGETGGGTSGGATGGRAGVTGGSSNTVASGGVAASSGGAAVATGGSPGTPGLVVGNDVDASAPSGHDACKAVGGECVLGPALDCLSVAVSVDCNPDRNPGGAVCCLQRAPVCDDSGTHTISVADYDTSCESHDDCLAVGEGDACSGVCAVVCPISAINRKDEARYRAALANILPDPPPFCGCHASFGPCCMNGHCSSSWQCVPPSP